MYRRRNHSPRPVKSSGSGFIQPVLVFVVMIALAACTDQPDSGEMYADTAGAFGSDTTGMLTEEPFTESDTVEVTLAAYQIDMPSTLDAGSHVFRVTNDGDVEHGFEIEGPGIEEAISSLAPGATETLEVDLQPGNYVAYCPVSDHRERGMEVQVTVANGRATAAAY